MNCIGCDQPLVAPTSASFIQCPLCQMIHFSHQHPSSFEVFGAKPSFKIDLPQLEQRYYQLCRLLHPDRHQNLNPKKLQHMQKLSALVNQAYLELKDWSMRLDYLVKSATSQLKIASTKSSAIPNDLADEFFDLETAEQKKTFALKINSLLKSETEQTIKIAETIDWQNPQTQLIENLIALKNSSQYLKSLLSNLNTGDRQ